MLCDQMLGIWWYMVFLHCHSVMSLEQLPVFMINICNQDNMSSKTVFYFRQWRFHASNNTTVWTKIEINMHFMVQSYCFHGLLAPHHCLDSSLFGPPSNWEQDITLHYTTKRWPKYVRFCETKQTPAFFGVMHHQKPIMFNGKLTLFW